MTAEKSLKDQILKILDEKKATEIVQIDTSSFNARMSDLCIIACGTSSRHMQSVADYIYKFMKSEGLKPHMEGTAKSGWILIESFGIEIHLFKPDLREYYDLESILKDGKKPTDVL